MKLSKKDLFLLVVYAAIISMTVMALLRASLRQSLDQDAEQPSRVSATVTPSLPVTETIIQETPVPTGEPEDPAEEPTMIFDVPLDADLQLHIISLCEYYHIEPAVVMAMIERESSFRTDALGDSGKSYGLMQIQARWHEERMERLGVSDLLNPYQNVLVGIDYMAELCERYECIGMALMAYNAGPSGAKTYYWDKGIFESKYSSGVLARSEELREGMIEYVCS